MLSAQQLETTNLKRFSAFRKLRETGIGKVKCLLGVELNPVLKGHAVPWRRTQAAVPLSAPPLRAALAPPCQSRAAAAAHAVVLPRVRAPAGQSRLSGCRAAAVQAPAWARRRSAASVRILYVQLGTQIAMVAAAARGASCTKKKFQEPTRFDTSDAAARARGARAT